MSSRKDLSAISRKHPTLRLHRDLDEAYPGLRAEVSAYRAAYCDEWPSCVYVPFGAYRRFEGESVATSGVVAWCATKGIYEFDPTLAESLKRTTISNRIPSDVLMRLPEWCVFVEEPTDNVEQGFFAWVDMIDDECPALVTMALTGDGLVGLPFALPLVGTIAEAVSKLIDVGLPGPLAKVCVDHVAERLPLILYLCSEEPDIVERGEKGSSRGRHRAGRTLGVRAWNIGFRVGSALRKAKDHRDNASTGGGAHVASRCSPRPHVRVGHFQLFWTGRGRTVPRVRWVAPTLVNGDGIVPTQRHVPDRGAA